MPMLARHRSIFAAGAFALATATLAACSQPGQPLHPFSKEGHSLMEQLEVNWNLPSGGRCLSKVSARIAMAPDGSVTGVEPVEPMPTDPACHAVFQSLHRAAVVSSPFWFPPGQTPPSVVVRFDPENFKEYY